MRTVIIENVQIPVVNIVIQFLFHMPTNIILLWLIVVCIMLLHGMLMMIVYHVYIICMLN